MFPFVEIITSTNFLKYRTDLSGCGRGGEQTWTDRHEYANSISHIASDVITVLNRTKHNAGKHIYAIDTLFQFQ